MRASFQLAAHAGQSCQDLTFTQQAGIVNALANSSGTSSNQVGMHVHGCILHTCMHACMHGSKIRLTKKTRVLQPTGCIRQSSSGALVASDRVLLVHSLHLWFSACCCTASEYAGGGGTGRGSVSPQSIASVHACYPARVCNCRLHSSLPLPFRQPSHLLQCHVSYAACMSARMQVVLVCNGAQRRFALEDTILAGVSGLGSHTGATAAAGRRRLLQAYQLHYYITGGT